MTALALLRLLNCDCLAKAGDAPGFERGEVLAGELKGVGGSSR